MSNDCGVLAIAFALTLARGKDPERTSYDPNLLRQHLSMFLKNGHFTEFPEVQKRLLRVETKHVRMKLFCVCRRPYFKGQDELHSGLRMAKCSVCGQWQHQLCLKIPELVFKKETTLYKCRSCSQN